MRRAKGKLHAHNFHGLATSRFRPKPALSSCTSTVKSSPSSLINASHVSQVREMLPSFTQFMASTGQSGKLVDMPIVYHVEGDINAAYSEILLNRICDSE